MSEAIILKLHHYGESDVVLRILTDQRGKLAVIARSARLSKRRFCGGLDLFDRGSFETARGRGALPILNSFTSLGAQRGLREDLDKFVLASFLCECFDALIPEGETEDSAQVFSYLGGGLRELEAARDLKSGLRAVFLALASLLGHSGYLDPELDLTPTKRNLEQLIAVVENNCDQRLSSLAELHKLLTTLG